MNLHAFKALLASQGGKHFRLQLPDGSPVPVSFHVTEVGHVKKTFIDCGGTLRTAESCQLQVWVGEDVDHRIEAKKAAAILEKAKSFLPDETIPVEIEYEDRVVSQYVIVGHAIKDQSVVLKLGHKHTDCLAKELCGVPVKAGSADETATSCCSGTGCC
jgi:hypothetical protein